MSHPNLLVGDEGQLAAVDWELGEPVGLPAHDLAAFLGYLAVARARAERPADQRAALRALLLGDTGWADAAATRYATAIGLDPGLLPALGVVAWARRVVGLVERLYDGPATSLDDETLDWIRGHRWTTAWDAALERHDRAIR